MFFSAFWAWLQGQLATYVGSNTAAVAAAIEPAAVTLATIYVMMWGYMSLTGRIQEPILEGFKRIVVMALILGIGIHLWTYNTLIVDTVFNAPNQLAQQIIGSNSSIATIDEIWLQGGRVATALWRQGGILNGDIGFYAAAIFVFVIIGAVAVYSMFLIALSKVALSLILVLGPLFIVFLFFDATKRFFESWVAMLANYALITVLTVLAASLLLQSVQNHAAVAALVGASISTVDILDMLLISALVLLVMRQVPSIASGLASGIALSTFGAVSGLMNWGLGASKRTGYQFGRGVMDGLKGESTSRWDPLRRSAGNRVGQGLARLTGRGSQGGSVVPRHRVLPPPSGRR